MSEVKSPQLKNLIYDLLVFTDDFDANGKAQRRTTYTKKHYKGAVGLQSKILNALLVGIYDKEIKDIKSVDDERIEWIEYSLLKDNKDKNVFAERHTDTAITLNDKELAALKYYYQERQEIPQTTMETFEELEKLLGIHGN